MSMLTNERFLDPRTGKSLMPKIIPASIYIFGLPRLARANPMFFFFKVGETYRDVTKRLEEWRKRPGYEDLELIGTMPICFTVENGSVEVWGSDRNFHAALRKLGYSSLMDMLKRNKNAIDTTTLSHISREIFVSDKSLGYEEISKLVLEECAEDIRRSYGKPDSPYTYYSEPERIVRTEVKFEAIENFRPRGYQNRAIEELMRVFTFHRRDKALLYMRTRSGKTYTAGWFLKSLFAHLKETTGVSHHCVVWTSAKIDALFEALRAFQGHVDFGLADENGKVPFAVVTNSDLDRAAALPERVNAIEEAYKTAHNVIVLQSLQDLAGSTKDKYTAKPRHNQLVGRVSFVVNDECHFGSFGTRRSGVALFGENSLSDSAKIEESNEDSNAMLFREAELTANEIQQEAADRLMLEEAAAEVFSSLKPRYGSLFITATPGSIFTKHGLEFSKDSIVAITTKDIEEDAAMWIAEHPDSPEYESPHFGSPETWSWVLNAGDPGVVFGVNPDGSIRDPQSWRKVLEALFSASDKEPGIPNFMQNNEFRESGGGQCVMIRTGRKLGCDFTEDELNCIIDPNEILIMNISSARGNIYTNMSPTEIKAAISRTRAEGKRVVILTVNKMTTGVTIPELDTTMDMSNGASNESYMQFHGRVNSPNNRVVVDSVTGESRRVCDKPFTHNISFNPLAEYSARFENDQNERKASGIPASYDKGEALSGPNVVEISTTGELRRMTAIDIQQAIFEEMTRRSLSFAIEGIAIRLDKMSAETEELLKKADFEILSSKRANFSSRLYESLPFDPTMCSACQITEALAGQVNNLCKNCWNLSEEEHRRIKAERIAEQRAKAREEAEQQEISSPQNTSNSKNDEEEQTKDIEAANKKDNYAAKRREMVLSQLKLLLIFVFVMFEQSFDSFKQVIEFFDSEEGAISAKLFGLDAAVLTGIYDDGILGDDFDRLILDYSSMKHMDVSAEDKLMMLIGKATEVSNNEYLTPRETAQNVIGMLNASNDDWLDLVLGDGLGILDLGSKTGILLAVAYSRIVESVRDSGFSDDDQEWLLERARNEKLWALPTSSRTSFIVGKTFSDFGFNRNHILNVDVREGLKLARTQFEKMGGVWGEQETTGFLLDRGFDTMVREAYACWKLRQEDLLKAKRAKRKADRVSQEQLDTWTQQASQAVDSLRDDLALVTEGKSFDFVVGNPPYQEDNANNDSNIYPDFWNSAVLLNPKRLSMVMPARWYTSGRGLDEFRSQMIADRRISSIRDYQNGSDCFPGTSITGGVCIIRWEIHHDGDCLFIQDSNGKIVHKGIVDLRTGEDVVIRDHMAFEAIAAVKKKAVKFESARVSKRDPFGGHLTTNYQYAKSQPFEGSIPLVFNDKIEYITKEEVKRHFEWVEMWKVLIPKAHGNMKVVLGEPIGIAPGSASTQSYLVAGVFATIKEANNYAHYLATKFARYLVLQRKVSQDNTSDCFKFVPQMDLSRRWTDENLYDFFDFSQELREHIEKTIRPRSVNLSLDSPIPASHIEKMRRAAAKPYNN